MEELLLGWIWHDCNGSTVYTIKKWLRSCCLHLPGKKQKHHSECRKPKSNWHSSAILLLSRFSRVRLCATPETAAHQPPLSLGFSRQEHWSGLPFPSPMHESEKWKWSRSVVSDSVRPHGPQPTRLLCPWDFPGESNGVGCHCLLPICCLGWSQLFFQGASTF